MSRYTKERATSGQMLRQYRNVVPWNVPSFSRDVHDRAQNYGVVIFARQVLMKSPAATVQAWEGDFSCRL